MMQVLQGTGIPDSGIPAVASFMLNDMSLPARGREQL